MDTSWPSEGMNVSYGQGDELADNGGTREFVTRPNKNNWDKFFFEFRLIGRPMRHVQHIFPVQDARAIPARKDGSKPKYQSFYCLGSPAETDPAEVWEIMEGAMRCAAIRIPGTDVGLHNCTDIEGGFTNHLLRAPIINWTTKTIQILEVKVSGWQGLIDNLNRDAARLAAAGEKLDVTKYAWQMRCMKPGKGSAAYWTLMEPVANPHTRADAVELLKQKADKYREVISHLNPVMLEEEIRRQIGASPIRPLEAGQTNPFGDPAPVTPSSAAADDFAAAANAGLAELGPSDAELPTL